MGRSRSRSRSRSRGRSAGRSRRQESRSRSRSGEKRSYYELALSRGAEIARLERRCERLRSERDEAVRVRRKAEAELEDALHALAERGRRAGSLPIRQAYIEQRVIETVNQLQPQWQVEVGRSPAGETSEPEREFEAYATEVSEQLETAFAMRSTASILWTASAGAARPSRYEVDMARPDSKLEQRNKVSGSRRRVRRELVPLERSQEELEEQRPPPLFLEKYPSCWLGGRDIEQVELPADGAVGSRLLDFMLSSLVACSAGAMSGLEIKKVERVENHLLWENYQRYRHNVVKRMDCLDHRPFPLSQRAAVAAVLGAEAAATKSNSDKQKDTETDTETETDTDTLPDELRSRVLCDETSELWLFHGTKPGLVSTVTTHGLDPRRSNLSGLYGAGTYFADSASKSHQYSKHEDADGCRCMLLCRVTMGDPFMTDHKHQNERLPPENPAMPGRPHDSIFAETGVAPGMNGSGGQKHNEYVVFHPDASYPEYIIYYKVSTPGIKERAVAGVPLDVQQFLERVGLGAWTHYFAAHIPNMVRSVQLARSITKVELLRMATAANMRLDAKTTEEVLKALKK